MNKKVVKRLDSDKMAELKGFEDVMDLILDENEKVEEKKRKRESDKLGEDHEIFNFLEFEVERQKRIDRFYAVKAPNKIKHDQSDKMVEKEVEHRFHLKNKLVLAMMETDSNLIQNLSLLFKHGFGLKK
ncbi:hypothetical protein M899_0368 [Bacteriovorax sp. BSW11_IV]|uniref:hypothetical protein n=1 Tax=Bacteriovorax sp. BSW11_IV TaxID=1353529 RepID=UPI00038A1595|nr:hypothetical protein [Bacteriovorax sp. BSW11_IV]EQC43084.1 hypothetical protein M899_0368 [Bacteriovorax sp. BSW11_IV]